MMIDSFHLILFYLAEYVSRGGLSKGQVAAPLTSFPLQTRNAGINLNNSLERVAVKQPGEV